MNLLAPNAVICCQPIGEGAFGLVRMCRVRTEEGAWVDGVIKTLKARDNPEQVDMFEREASVLYRLQGIEGVPVFYGRYGVHPVKDIVMSYNGGRTYFDWIKDNLLVPKTPELLCKTLYILRRVGEILDQIHATGYGHNDLHMSNIVLDDNFNPTVIDFGFGLKFGSILFDHEMNLKRALGWHYDPLLSVYKERTCPENDVFSYALMVAYNIIQRFNHLIEPYDQLDYLVARALRPDKSNRPTLTEFTECLKKLEEKYT